MTTAEGAADGTATPAHVDSLVYVLGLVHAANQADLGSALPGAVDTSLGLRMVLCHFEGQHPTLRTPERVWHFLAANVMPETVISVIEALVQERLLSRAEGGRIEEQILACVGADGDWAAPH